MSEMRRDYCMICGSDGADWDEGVRYCTKCELALSVHPSKGAPARRLVVVRPDQRPRTDTNVVSEIAAIASRRSAAARVIGGVSSLALRRLQRERRERER